MDRPKDALPTLDQFKGRSLRAYLTALVEWLRNERDRPDAPGKPHTILVYTQSGGISARSGTTAGSGTVEIVTWDGTTLDNSGNGTITVYNAYGAAFTGSVYVWCSRWKGVYWAKTQECS
jgi:hypothetical protein